MSYTFGRCKAMEIAPNIPNGVKALDGTFCDCMTLTTIPAIPASATIIECMVQNCENLTGTIIIDTNTCHYENCFNGTTKPITITGKSQNLEDIANEYANVDYK